MGLLRPFRRGHPIRSRSTCWLRARGTPFSCADGSMPGSTTSDALEAEQKDMMTLVRAGRIGSRSHRSIEMMDPCLRTSMVWNRVQWLRSSYCTSSITSFASPPSLVPFSAGNSGDSNLNDFIRNDSTSLSLTDATAPLPIGRPAIQVAHDIHFQLVEQSSLKRHTRPELNIIR